MSKLLAMLMNLQKEQFINLNINGSPTINNNIVSNFSTNNYIRLDYPFDLSKNIEIEFDFTTSNDVTTQQSLFWQDKGFGCFIQNNNLLFHIRDNNENISKTANITINADTNYKIRIVKIGTTVKWFIGSTSLIEQESFINRDFTNLTNYYMTVGIAIGSNTYFSGSVNFTNSYTKIDNIKYKYQFTILLTKVGNPTIVDGVVSGFSSSNYLTISAYSDTINSLELVFKIKTKPTTITNNALICSLNGSITFRSFVTSGNKVQFSYKDINNTTRNVPSINNVSDGLFVKFILNSLGAKLYFSTNGTSWNEEYSRDDVADFSGGITDGRIGYLSNTYNVFDGSIDVPNCYLIKDGTKYILTLP